MGGEPLPPAVTAHDFEPCTGLSENPVVPTLASQFIDKNLAHQARNFRKVGFYSLVHARILLFMLISFKLLKLKE